MLAVKQPPLKLKDAAPLALAGLLVLAALVGLFFLNRWLAERFPPGEDFLAPWLGARAFLFERTDPYGGTVAAKVQAEVYGRLARSTEFPYALDVPFPILLFYFPFALISDVNSARAAWMLVSELALIGVIPLTLNLIEWRPRPLFYAALLLSPFASYYGATALLSGSAAPLLVALLALAVLLLQYGNDEGAGVLLALTAFHWEATLLLWAFLAVGIYLTRRWRVAAGFSMTQIVIGGIAFLVYPDWVWPFLRAVTANLRAEDTLTLTVLFTRWWPEYGARLALGAIAFLLIVLFVEWAGALRGDLKRFVWAMCLSLAVTPLIGFSATFANLSALLFALPVIAHLAWERWGRNGYLAASLFLLLFFALPIFLRWYFADDRNLADGLTFLAIPLLTILSLYWVRWWAVRPPSTWLDEARRELRK
ncbi:MAG: hypothetical protein AB1554_02365 [Chloroflexota bacterium]